MTIDFQNISKRFAKQTEREVAALDNVDFEVQEHQFVSIVGPSGCGKTTLLKIVAGLVHPDTGRIVFPENTQPTTALVFQEQGLLPWLTVEDNIGLGLEIQGVAPRLRSAQVIDFMDRVKLTGFGDHYPHELSGGMRQRVALARAFLTKPDILLMDEPFASLDAQTRIILQQELLNIWREERNTVLFVTHDIDEAIMLGDRIIVLSDRPGRVHADLPIELGRPRDLTVRDDPRTRELRKTIWDMLEKEVRQELQLNE